MTPTPGMGCCRPGLCGEHAPWAGPGGAYVLTQLVFTVTFKGHATSLLSPRELGGGGLTRPAQWHSLGRAPVSHPGDPSPTPATQRRGPPSQRCLRSVTAVPMGQGHGQAAGRAGRACSPLPIFMEDKNTRPGAWRGEEMPSEMPPFYLGVILPQSSQSSS